MLKKGRMRRPEKKVYSEERKNEMARKESLFCLMKWPGEKVYSMSM